MAEIELRVHLGVHYYYEFIDDDGNRFTHGQINGFSYDPKKGYTDIGSPFNPDDQVRMTYNRILSGTSDINSHTGTTIYTGSESDLEDAIDILIELSKFINSQQLPYTPVPASDDIYNSNSVANTVWNVLSDLLVFPAGSLSSNFGLLPGVTNDALQGNYWSPNVDGSGNIVGSSVLDSGDSNIISGTEGDDQLLGISGNDILYGSAGSDVLDGGDTPGTIDTADYSKYEGSLVEINMLNGDGTVEKSDGSIDTLISIENIVGTKASDNIQGDNGENAIDGGAGVDVIRGGGGNDTLAGGANIDSALYSGYYADYTVSRIGDSKYRITDNLASDGNDGTDTVHLIEKIIFADGELYQGRFESTVIQNPVANVDITTVLANGSVNIAVLDNDYDPDQTGLSVVSASTASNGSVTIETNGTITYEPDSNFAGTDSFTYTVENGDGKTSTASVNVVVGASGFLTLGTSGNDNPLDGDGSDNTIDGLAGQDVINGMAGDDHLYGGTGVDTISGGADSDHIYGGDGNDILTGGSGNDYLYGGSGDDTFIGNEGISYYDGGSGRDTYEFDVSIDSGWAGITENDTSGLDVIELENTESGDRIEFQYSASTNQLDAYYYETSGGSFDFSFSVSTTAIASGKGVEYIKIDGKAYSLANIIAASDAETNNTFVFDIDEYETSGKYPSILPDGTISDGTALDIQDGKTSIYDGYSSSVSTTIIENATEYFHPVTFDGTYDPENHPTTTFSALMRIPGSRAQ